MSTRTQTSIVNDALTRIGSTRKLIDIGDPGQLAEDARAMWSSTVDDAIASHPWNFAIRRARLNRAAEIPAPGY
ncbi:hypothetical protein [Croceicoccus sp. YJ47]|uniref:hypothetical protein n=1 Tax=Croceicoccus sp. YJ47 TaxID=2798724 RepID=UPI001923B4FD|nr:hypothetical protein [Croceicoccus sp. YJ47]QQN75042.1 hypothetical protein JD971_04920 [Croceicoccus sp. YJ47]